MGLTLTCCTNIFFSNLTWRRGSLLFLIAYSLLPSIAQAVPSFARQTGAECAACHTVYPELTPFGRQFKLRGYTLGELNAENSPTGKLPIAALLQISRTETAQTNTPGAMPSDFPNDRKTLVQAAGLYYAGKITDNAGALVQYSYNGFEKRWAVEMADIRYANSLKLSNGKEFLYGVTLSNSPTITDPYNSTSMWGFPYSSTAEVMPIQGPIIDMALASKVAGPGVYALYNDWLYAEVAAYRTTNTGALRPLGLGNWSKTANVVDGYAPYWRVAVQREIDGKHSLSLGAFGLDANVFPGNNTSGGTDRFRDYGLDGQYQYIADEHIFSLQGRYTKEQQTRSESFATMAASNLNNDLASLKLGGNYYFKRQYGIRTQYFKTTGSSDTNLYNMGGMGTPVMGSINANPETSGWVNELVYLPLPNTTLSLRYTSYSMFNGASTNYDGNGRNAKDNNSIYLLARILF